MLSVGHFPPYGPPGNPARVKGGPSFFMEVAAAEGIFLPSGEINDAARISGCMIPMYVRMAQK